MSCKLHTYFSRISSSFYKSSAPISPCGCFDITSSASSNPNSVCLINS